MALNFQNEASRSHDDRNAEELTVAIMFDNEMRRFLWHNSISLEYVQNIYIFYKIYQRVQLFYLIKMHDVSC